MLQGNDGQSEDANCLRRELVFLGPGSVFQVHSLQRTKAEISGKGSFISCIVMSDNAQSPLEMVR